MNENKKTKSGKKGMKIAIVLIAVVLIIMLAFSLSKKGNKNVSEGVGGNIEKIVVGKWQLVGSSSCDFMDNDLLRINKDKTLEGVSDFNLYQYKNAEGIDHLIFSGYGDSKRFEVGFNGSNQLEILEENVSDSLTCTFEKME